MVWRALTAADFTCEWDALAAQSAPRAARLADLYRRLLPSYFVRPHRQPTPDDINAAATEAAVEAERLGAPHARCVPRRSN